MRRGVETGAKRADKEKPERARQHGGAGDEAGQHAEYRTGLQREAASEGLGQDADRQRADPHAHRHEADRHRSQRRIGRQHGADNPAGRHDHRVVAAGKRLSRREDERIACRQAVVGNVGDCFRQRRHRQKSCSAPF
jgi:hypothetical protein